MFRQNKYEVLKLGVWNLKVLYVIFFVNLEHSLKQLGVDQSDQKQNSLKRLN